MSLRYPVMALMLVLALPGCSPGTSGRADVPRPSSLPVQSRLTLLVVGDSYAAGVGADTDHTSFAWELGRNLNMTTTVDGVGGTGFVNPGPGNADQTYLSRAVTGTAEVLRADVIVVEGGLNDRQYPAQEVRTAADAFLTELLSRAHDPVVVLVGAPAPVPDEPAASAAVNAALHLAAQEHDVTFVDPTEQRWFTEANVDEFIGSDGLHPNQAGHDYFARRIADAVEPLLAD